MNRLKTIILSLTIMLCACTLISQSAVTEIKRNIYGNPMDDVNQNYIRMINQTEDMKNNRVSFFYDDWMPMKVTGLDGATFEVDSANYHLDNDIFLFYNDGEYMVLHNGRVKQVDFEGNRFREISDLGFGEIMVEGELLLFKKYKLKTKKEQTNSLGIPGTARIVTVKSSDLYYYDTNKDEYAKVPGRKSDVLKILRKKKSKMLEFARKRDLSLKSDSDVILLFQYYNRLVELDKASEDG